MMEHYPPEPLCPDSPDGNHHCAPIGSEEDVTLACTECWYCGEKATKIQDVDAALRTIAFYVPTVCYEHDDRRYVDIEEVFALKRIAADARSTK